MVILGIETSCDETGAAVLSQNPSTGSGQAGRIKILSNVVASSANLQSKYGGIIPEQAAREQIKSIIPVIKEALGEAKIKPEELDAIAVTQGPGLIGSLLVGVETTKILSLIWQKPLIPVNHLIGHFYANWITVKGDAESKSDFEIPSWQDPEQETPKFPCLGLLVSGGHTDLVLFKEELSSFKNHGQYKYLGGTRDDAAGECFDKCARLLGLGYPGGPLISKQAINGDPTSFNLPRPMSNSNDFDFSFSGLKTAVANLVPSLNLPNDLPNICASIEQAIIDSLIKKVITAAKRFYIEQIMVAGGVAANNKLTLELKRAIATEELPIKLFIPPPYLCTDNGAMIASAAFFISPTSDPLTLQANPNLSLAY